MGPEATRTVQYQTQIGTNTDGEFAILTGGSELDNYVVEAGDSIRITTVTQIRVNPIVADDFSPTGAWDFSGSSLVTLPASFELPVGTTIIDNDGAQALVANIDDVTILLDNTIDEQTFVIDNDGFLVANNIRSEALIQDPIANRFELLLGTSSAESNGGPAGDENYTQFVHGIYGTWYLFPARVPGGLFSDNINPDDPNAVTFNLIG